MLSRPPSGNLVTTCLPFIAIAIGTALGLAVPGADGLVDRLVDPTIWLLVAGLFFQTRFTGLAAVRRAPLVVALAWTTNFVIIPALALGLTRLFFPGDAELRTGTLLYFLFPCTDWFLGFTRMARGNTATGAGLLGINMITQLIVFPIYLGLLGGQTGEVTLAHTAPTLLIWVALPTIGGIGAQATIRRLTPRVAPAAISAAGRAVPVIIAMLITELFAGHVAVIMAHRAAFAGVLAVVFVFLVTTYLLGELTSRTFRLAYPDRALLAMTTAARNAPLTLAMTTLAMPHRPLVQAALVLGMLVEFPHLTVIKHLLLRSAPPAGGATPSDRSGPTRRPVGPGGRPRPAAAGPDPITP